MKRVTPILMIILLLCACSGTDGEESGPASEALKEYYQTLESAQYTVTQQTDFGDRVMDFRFTYSFSREGDDTLEVLAPEAISGIRASLAGEGARIEFEGLVLDLGKLPGTGLSPLEVLPFLIDQWRNGYVSSEGREELGGRACLRVAYKTTQSGVAVEHHAWFDEETHTPVRAELFFDGAQVVACTFE